MWIKAASNDERALAPLHTSEGAAVATLLPEMDWHGSEIVKWQELVKAERL